MLFSDICSTKKNCLALFRISQLFNQLEGAEVSEEIRNTTNIYCSHVNQKWPILAKRQVSNMKGLLADDCISL